MSDLGSDFVNTADLKKRWRKKDIKTVRRIIARYQEILKPVKIGRILLLEIENVRAFEDGMRVINIPKKGMKKE